MSETTWDEFLSDLNPSTRAYVQATGRAERAATAARQQRDEEDAAIRQALLKLSKAARRGTVDPEHLTPAEAAALLGVATKVILALIGRGELAASDVSSQRNGSRHKPRWRISRQDLQQFLQRRQVQRPEPRRRMPSNVKEYF
ncbi:MAG: helix-turn-helix domain-containing protein [Planctomycetes bacterium]|nr:helix-turn-helix domain-containing protein [Planctomycetota bacterium]